MKHIITYDIKFALFHTTTYYKDNIKKKKLKTKNNRKFKKIYIIELNAETYTFSLDHKF